jgi:hypothetical protein
MIYTDYITMWAICTILHKPTNKLYSIWRKKKKLHIFGNYIICILLWRRDINRIPLEWDESYTYILHQLKPSPQEWEAFILHL